VNRTWIEGLNQIAAGLLFSGGYVHAPVPPAADDDLEKADAVCQHAAATRASTVTPGVSVLRPLPR
jgi:hypothetical protein